MKVGIIGTGDMGKLYARLFDEAGYKVNCCDLPENTANLKEKFNGTGINVLNDGIAVSRVSDLIFYLVPTENIKGTVALYGPSTKEGAIVSSGTSVMTPAVEAFEAYLPKDASIINWHLLFGPSVDPNGQSSILVNHRSSDDAYFEARDAFEIMGTNIIELPTYCEHDKITADTQSLTHVNFEAMGTAWKNAGFYPWENTSYVGGIDNVKVLMCLRIHSGKPHVYSGLAMLNPYVKEQVVQYAKSESELFELMIKEDSEKFRERIMTAGKWIFGNLETPILLDDKVMDEFSLGLSSENRTPNSHLGPFSKIDAWYRMGINPYKNQICQTPISRLLLGISEYLYRDRDLLEESVSAALYNKRIRGDDLKFHTAVNTWAKIIENGDKKGYEKEFIETKSFFKSRLTEGVQKSGELIKRLTQKNDDSLSTLFKL